MDRIKQFIWPSQKAAYDALGDNSTGDGEDEALIRASLPDEDDVDDESILHEQVPFQWLYYGVFMLLGVAMLWAWNMFLAAGPYFQSRFRDNDWLLANFQSTELTVSTVANLGSLLVLTNMQAGASYPRRIISALLGNVGLFALLALSTALTGISPEVYFFFLMAMVFFSSLCTGLMQNGIFAYMSSFGREEYAQGNMTGQAVAGILPCIVQIVSVLSIPSTDDTKVGPATDSGSKSALVYFATASGISLITLVAFVYLLAVHSRSKAFEILSRQASASASAASLPPRRQGVPLTLLFRKTFHLSTALFLTFAIAMFFPVFTQRILSLDPSTPLTRPTAFIPFAFLLWNAGDLSGRILAAVPALRLTHRPYAVLAFAAGRILLIPMYYLCNVDGAGARIGSDWFYFVLQIVYGATNGFIGTTCLMGAVEYVDVQEREAVGAFVALVLVAGLTVGSVASFAVA